MDDRDLDDAELWAVIDSAAASRSRRPLLAIKNTNSPSSIPTRYPSPVLPRPSRNPRHQKPAEAIRVQADGEVVQDHWAHRHPQKVARFADPVTIDDHRVLVVRHPPLTPPVSLLSYSTPPDSGRFSAKVSPVIESPPADHWKSEEKENPRHSLSGQFPSVSLFKQYQNAAMAILEKTDYTMIAGSPFIKKSGWRKISFFFNLSFEIKDKSIEFDEKRNVQRAEFVVRAYMQGGRFSDGWGSCDRHEKRFQKPNHDIPSTAETRAKNKACQDLLGIGQYQPGASNGYQ